MANKDSCHINITVDFHAINQFEIYITFFLLLHDKQKYKCSSHANDVVCRFVVGHRNTRMTEWLAVIPRQQTFEEESLAWMTEAGHQQTQHGTWHFDTLCFWLRWWQGEDQSHHLVKSRWWGTRQKQIPPQTQLLIYKTISYHRYFGKLVGQGSPEQGIHHKTIHWPCMDLWSWENIWFHFWW